MSRLASFVILAIAAGGARSAGGQQRLLVLPFEISTPEDSALTHELAAIVREQLTVALLGEVQVVEEPQRIEAFQAARLPANAILPPSTARQMAHFLRADLFVIGSLAPSDSTVTVELYASTERNSRMTATVACPFRGEIVRCSGMVVDSILRGTR